MEQTRATDRDEAVTGLRLLKRGSWGNADIYEGTVGGVGVIVKDFSEKSLLVRAVVGPVTIRRERHAYRALQGLSGIARLFEPEGDRRLIVGRIDGEALSSRPSGSVGASAFRQLEEMVAELHRRGLVHLDLTHRGNILIDSSDRPWLIDLASVFDFSWLGPVGRSLALRVGFFDRAAVAKWKARLCSEPLTPNQERDLRLLTRITRFWLLNRKKRR